MSVLWIIVLCLAALVWVLSVVDIVRQHYSGWTTAGWLALVLVLPIVGSITYWFTRKPRREDAEQQYSRRPTGGAAPGHGPSTAWAWGP
jgi:Phospholipase_D-nuclease N-terminal